MDTFKALLQTKMIPCVTLRKIDVIIITTKTLCEIFFY